MGIPSSGDSVQWPGDSIQLGFRPVGILGTYYLPFFDSDQDIKSKCKTVGEIHVIFLRDPTVLQINVIRIPFSI